MKTTIDYCITYTTFHIKAQNDNYIQGISTKNAARSRHFINMEAQNNCCCQSCCKQACVKKNRTVYEKLILKATQQLRSLILFSSPYHLIGLKLQAKECRQSIRPSLSLCLHMKNKYFNEHVILILIIIDISSTSSITGYHFALALANCLVQQRAEKNKYTKNQVMMMMAMAVMTTIPFKYSPSLILENFFNTCFFIFFLAS